MEYERIVDELFLEVVREKVEQLETEANACRGEIDEMKIKAEQPNLTNKEKRKLASQLKKLLRNNDVIQEGVKQHMEYIDKIVGRLQKVQEEEQEEDEYITVPVRYNNDPEQCGLRVPVSFTVQREDGTTYEVKETIIIKDWAHLIEEE